MKGGMPENPAAYQSQNNLIERDFCLAWRGFYANPKIFRT
jgi:hypothetical protein